MACLLRSGRKVFSEKSLGKEGIANRIRIITMSGDSTRIRVLKALAKPVATHNKNS